MSKEKEEENWKESGGRVRYTYIFEAMYVPVQAKQTFGCVRELVQLVQLVQ